MTVCLPLHGGGDIPASTATGATGAVQGVDRPTAWMVSGPLFGRAGAPRVVALDSGLEARSPPGTVMRTSMAPSETWAPGMMIPGTVYRVVRPLGQGGMGEVYEVEHDLLGARRALKVLARHFAGREDLSERLRVEARGLARLKHPNLVEVYDLATAADQRIFFAMELLDGSTLRDLLRHKGRLSPRLAVRLLAQALDGLHAAHCAHMIHRDIKPENVFVCRSGLVKLLDFGVAKAIDAWMPAQQITGAGMTVGTPRYMSPEQAEGKPLDGRTDVYAAGLVLWEALVGRPAFEESDPIVLAVVKITKGVRSLEQAGIHGIPPALCAAVDKACAREQEQRFCSAEVFATEIRRAVGESLRPRRMAASEAAYEIDDSELTTATEIPQASEHRSTGALSTSVSSDAPTPLRIASAQGADTIPDAVQRELTERLDTLGAMDPDAPTQCNATPESRVVGPKGTHMLPSVAAQHRATAEQEQQIAGRRNNESSLSFEPGLHPEALPGSGRPGSVPPATKQTVRLDPLVNSSRSRDWIAGGLAFGIPVFVALAASGLYLAQAKRHPQLVDPATAAESPTPLNTPASAVFDLASQGPGGQPSVGAVHSARPTGPAPDVSAVESDERVLSRVPRRETKIAPEPPPTQTQANAKSSVAPQPAKASGERSGSSVPAAAEPVRSMPASGL